VDRVETTSAGKDVEVLPLSVIMTCYNEGDYIGAAVRSVLDQTCADQIESIVIVDDGSARETLDVLDQIQTWDPRIKVVRSPGGVRVAACRNLGVSHSRGEVVAFLDGDDLWSPTKAELQLAHFADPKVGLSYTGFHAFVGQDLKGARPVQVRDITRGDDLVRTYFLHDPVLNPSSVMVRRKTFEAIGGFNPDVQLFEDTDFYLRMARVARFAVRTEPLIYKREREGSMTSRRRSLMAHHALVAFRAAETDRRLLPLVPARLSERARKLGNVEYRAGEIGFARDLYRLALALRSSNLLAWLGLFATLGGARLSRLLVKRVR
jgi:glycosyltransferase involved in cell wall biosynthesis